MDISIHYTVYTFGNCVIHIARIEHSTCAIFYTCYITQLQNVGHYIVWTVELDAYLYGVATKIEKVRSQMHIGLRFEV